MSGHGSEARGRGRSWWASVVVCAALGCDNPPPPAQPAPEAGVDADAPDDGGAPPDADAARPLEERGPDVADAAPEASPDAPEVGEDRPAEASVDVPLDVSPDALSPPSDAGPVVRGGVGSLGPRGWSRGPTTVVDDGFEYAGHRACAGAVCVTGGFVQ